MSEAAAVVAAIARGQEKAREIEGHRAQLEATMQALLDAYGVRAMEAAVAGVEALVLQRHFAKILGVRS